MIKAKTGPMTKSKYSKMESLAKEFGMVNMTQLIDYCVNGVLESHFPDRE